jgi:GSH-dependent disulfide-bond oxidoreductase
MIELYACSSPNVIKVLLMLSEVELPYKVHPVNIYSDQLKRPEFVALNPNSKLPVIVDSEGPEDTPFTVFESGAILLYLAEKTGKLLPTNAAARSRVTQWLMFQMAGIGPMFGQAIHFTRYKADDEYGRSRYVTEARRLHDVLEKRLGESPYLAGPDYSIADVAAFPWLKIREEMFFEMVFKGKQSDYPNIMRWWNSIASRPACARMGDIWQELREDSYANFKKAASDDVDRFVGRGRYARA